MNLHNFNAIQASEDPRVNLSAFLQLEALKQGQKESFSVDKPYFLHKAQGDGGRTASVVRNSIVSAMDGMGLSKSAQFAVLNSLGDSMQFAVREASATEVGGFTYNDCKRIAERMIESKQGFQNSLVDGLPFTYGVSGLNFNVPMPIKPSYEFLGSLDFASPATSTLFSVGEVLNLLDINGAPTDMTNGATNIGQASFGGSQVIAPYKTLGIGLAQLESSVASSGNGFAGDALIQQIYGYGLEIIKKNLLGAVMREVYAGLDNAMDGANKLVPTYTINDIAQITGKSLTDLFSSNAGIGDFITKIISAVNAPNNRFLETFQRKLTRIVAHTTFESAFSRTIPTFGFTGGTQGQVPSATSLKEALGDVSVTFGGDICPTNAPAETDLRLLFVADPSDSSMARPEHGFMRIVVALAPTIIANYSGAGFVNQTLITRFTQPEVMLPKCAFFLKGSK